MSFNPKIELGTQTIDILSEDSHTDKIQGPSSPLAGKTVVDLSDNSEIGERLEPYVDTQLSTQVLLPEGRMPLKQNVIEELKTFEAISRPVLYSRYIGPFYCSYDALIGAIENWGKVEAVFMASAGLNLSFIVSFKTPIRFSGRKEGITVNLTGGHGIWDTPFCLNSDSLTSVYLSNDMMAFNLRCLHLFGRFDASELESSREFIPDKRWDQITDKIGVRATWTVREKTINSTFSDTDRAKKLLEWIKQAGLKILEKGLHKSGTDCVGQFTADEVISKYENYSGWQLIMKSPK